MDVGRDGLRKLLNRWPRDDSLGILSDDGNLTYCQLHDRIDALEDSLSAFVQPGDVVGVCTRHGVDLIVLTLALSALRATVFLAHHALTDVELDALIAAENATAVLCDRERSGLSLQTASLAGIPHNVLLFRRTGGHRRILTEEPTVHLYTSGTDGRLKGVIRSQLSLALEADGIATMLGLTRATRLLCPVPLCHAYGFGMGMLGMLAAGSTLVLALPLSARLLRRCAEQQQPEILVAVPTLYRLWSRGPRQTLAPELLRLCISSGAPLPASIASAFEWTWGRKIARQYGMSECGPMAIDLAYSDEPTCVGRPYPGVRVLVHRSGTNDDEPGELTVFSPHIGSGYVGGLEAGLGNQSFRDGGLRTGDQGTIDADGRIHLLSRKTSQINVHGQKVDPAEVEAAIAQHPHVHDVVVLGVDRSDQDQWIAAFIVAEPRVSERDVERLCESKLAPYKRPSRVVRVSKIPRTPTFKPQRKLLLEWLDSTTRTASVTATATETLELPFESVKRRNPGSSRG